MKAMLIREVLEKVKKKRPRYLASGLYFGAAYPGSRSQP
jgi:hypothetical protein